MGKAHLLGWTAGQQLRSSLTNAAWHVATRLPAWPHSAPPRPTTASLLVPLHPSLHIPPFAPPWGHLALHLPPEQYHPLPCPDPPLPCPVPIQVTDEVSQKVLAFLEANQTSLPAAGPSAAAPAAPPVAKRCTQVFS